MSRTGIIIQARTGSKRFPNKVLADLNGSPVIQHVIDRCQQFHKRVILAVPYTDLGKFTQFGVPIVYGPENDVLERYYKAAHAYQLDTIVRITADCPLIQPELCQQTIELFHSGGCDIAAIDWPRTFPKGYGCEVMSWRALTFADCFAKEPHDREHVTPWLYRHVRSRYLVQDIDEAHLNYCVDTPSDLDRLRRLLKKNKT